MIGCEKNFIKRSILMANQGRVIYSLCARYPCIRMCVADRFVCRVGQSAEDAGPKERSDKSGVKDPFDLIKEGEVVVHVDLAAKIPASCFASGVAQMLCVADLCVCQAMTLATLPEALWPVQEVANKLASLRAKAVKAKVVVPFPLIDLVCAACWAPLRTRAACMCICCKADYLPGWSSDAVAAVDAPQGQKAKGKMDIVRWVAAFQAYALAADAAEVMCSFPCWAPLSAGCVCTCIFGQVWKYSSAIAHMNVCLEIASKAALEKKRFSLAIVYDEVCRREWSVKASRGMQFLPCVRSLLAVVAPSARSGDRGFDVNVASLQEGLGPLGEGSRRFRQGVGASCS